MTQFLKYIIMLSTFFTAATSAAAQPVGETTVSTGFSTLGINIEGAYQTSPNFRVRGVFMMFPEVDELSDSFENGGTTFDYDSTIGGVSALVDYYPMATGWRVSGGLVLNRVEVDAIATLSAGNAFNLDDGTMIDTGTARIVTEFRRKVSPILTTGYDYRYGENWIMSGEVGAIFSGGFSLDASSTNVTLQAEIDSDADIQQARENAGDSNVYPYLSFTFGYIF